MTSDISGNQQGAVVLIDLDTVSMATAVVALPQQLRQWARSPDVYALVLQRTRAAVPPAPSAITSEQAGDLLGLIWRLDCFPKPLIALLDAPLTPLDIGLSTLGTHRVGSEAYRLAIPAAPDLTSLPAAGIAYALARVPNGTDLVESGRTIDAREAHAAGLLTHTISAAEFPRIITALADGQPVDPLLDGLQRELHATHDDGGISRAIPRTEPSEALLRLVADARAMDVRESLIATYRLAVARQSLSDGADVKIDIAKKPISGDLKLPLRSEIESGRF